MLLHIFSADLELEDQEITLDESFQLLENQSTQEKVIDNFIGFTVETDEQSMIQFIRETKRDWLFDIPTYENSKYIGSLSTKVQHHQVFSITRDFFDINSLLHIGIVEKNYDSVIEYVRTRYGIIFKFETS